MRKNPKRASFTMLKKHIFTFVFAFVFGAVNIATAAIDVTDTASLNAALSDSGTPLEINFLNDIALTLSLIPQITEHLTIFGNGLALDGQGTHSGFRVNSLDLTNNVMNVGDGFTLKNFFHSGTTGASVIYNTAEDNVVGAIIGLGNHVTLSDNVGGGGAIVNMDTNTATLGTSLATVTVGDNATFTGNHCGGVAGVINNSSNASKGTANANITIGDNMFLSGNSGQNGTIANISGGNISNAILGIGKNAFATNNTTWGGTIFNQADATIADGNAVFASLTVGDNSKFITNTTEYGGALTNQAYGTSSNPATAILTIGDGLEFSGNTSEVLGGAVSNTTSITDFGLATANIIIGQNNIFTNNSSDVRGGAIVNWGYSMDGVDTNVTIGKGTSFSENSAPTGGAVFNFGNGYGETNTNVIVEDGVSFSKNTASMGGAIYNYALSPASTGTAKITVGNNVNFSNNSIAGTDDLHGGAIANIALSISDATTTLIIGDNVTFSNNNVVADNYYGGAISSYAKSLEGVANSYVTIGNEAKFLDNTATSTNYYGGAISSYALGIDGPAVSNVTVGNNAQFSGNIADNEQEGFGAAISGWAATTNGSADSTINVGSNAKFSNNSTSTYGGAIYNEASAAHTGTSATGVINIGSSSEFFENTTGGAGGVIFQYINARSEQGTATINIAENTTFSDNTTLSHGGAIYNFVASDINRSDAIINIGKNVNFSGNTGEIGPGGAIVNIAGNNLSVGPANATINIDENTVFSGNSAGTNGGAIYNWSYSASGVETTSVINIGDSVVFAGNSSGGHGGAIHNYSQNPVGNSEINIPGRALFTNNNDSTGPNDIYMAGSNAVMNITGASGAVTFESGIANSDTDAIINKTGNNTLNLGMSGKPNDSQFQTYTGTFNQTAGIANIFGHFLGGVNNMSNSTVNLLATIPSVKLGREFNTLGNATINSITGSPTHYTATDAIRVSGRNNFNIDVAIAGDGATGTSDNFYAPLFENLDKSSGGVGTLNVSGINLMGAPTAKVIPLEVFSYDVNDPVAFDTTVGQVKTPIYIYDFVANYTQPGGTYALIRESVNPQAYRGQVATEAMYNGQLSVINTLFDHVYLDSPDFVAQGMKNQYAYSGSGLFAPYQFSQNDGGLWAKAYGIFERLDMTHGLDIGNNLYGTIIGADFCPICLGDGWQFLPTAFIAYNGGHQTYDGVSMYQNGGQAGVMGTFFKNDFIGSILAYGGGYANEMKVEGFNDDTGNWFAGAAAKAAYNFRPARHWILQPSALVSYNAFGEQNWGSDFGALSMNSDMLNGINVTPGLNIIYARETWTTYLITLYTWNINDSIGGRAGDAHLDSIKMDHGWFEYGIGGTKTFKDDRLIAWGQTTIRNGGRTGIALQVGLTWKF